MAVNTVMYLIFSVFGLVVAVFIWRELLQWAHRTNYSIKLQEKILEELRKLNSK